MSPFGTRRFRPFGLVVLAYAGYRLLRRLTGSETGDAGTDRASAAAAPSAAGPRTVPPEPSAERVGATTAPAEEIVPDVRTSPSIADDPELERRRAKEAAVRERESRESDVTKFEELRAAEEAERAAQAATIGDAPAREETADR
jgi:hypothetical protein